MPDLDLDSFYRAADEFDAAKEEVQELLDQFTGALAQFANAFGGDEIGMLVGMAHEACTEVLNECFTTNIEEIADYAATIREMADNHQATDDGVAEIFNQLLSELSR